MKCDHIILPNGFVLSKEDDGINTLMARLIKTGYNSTQVLSRIRAFVSGYDNVAEYDGAFFIFESGLSKESLALLNNRRDQYLALNQSNGSSYEIRTCICCQTDFTCDIMSDQISCDDHIDNVSEKLTIHQYIFWIKANKHAKYHVSENVNYKQLQYCDVCGNLILESILDKEVENTILGKSKTISCCSAECRLKILKKQQRRKNRNIRKREIRNDTKLGPVIDGDDPLSWGYVNDRVPLLGGGSGCIDEYETEAYIDPDHIPECIKNTADY